MYTLLLDSDKIVLSIVKIPVYYVQVISRDILLKFIMKYSFRSYICFLIKKNSLPESPKMNSVWFEDRSLNALQ